MTASTGWSLQCGIYQALANSSQLGGTHIYDDPPQAASYPFISLGKSLLLRDWSTGTEDGAEHLLTLHVWSRAGGKKQVHDIIEAIKSTLHNQPLSLVGILRGAPGSGRRHLSWHRALPRVD